MAWYTCWNTELVFAGRNCTRISFRYPTSDQWRGISHCSLTPLSCLGKQETLEKFHITPEDLLCLKIHSRGLKSLKHWDCSYLPTRRRWGFSEPPYLCIQEWWFSPCSLSFLCNFKSVGSVMEHGYRTSHIHLKWKCPYVHTWTLKMEKWSSFRFHPLLDTHSLTLHSFTYRQVQNIFLNL